MAQTIKLKRSATQGAAPTTSNLALGEVAINTYDGKMYIKKDVGGTESIVEIGGSGAGTVSYLEAGMIEYEYTATSNQTTFSGSDTNSATLSYTANSIMVFLNGVLQDDGVDYTATNGTSVVFSSALTANDEVRIVAFTNVTTSAGLNNPTKLDAITTVNAQAAYSLTLDSSAYTPSSQNALIVSLNGITQEPGDSFTISGSTITFSPALVTGDVVDYIVDMGRVVTIGQYDSDLVVTGDITPGADSTYDLGASGTEWANVYADTFTGNLTGNVTGTVSSLSNHDTDDLSEGSTNLYYTNTRVDSHLSGGTGVTYNAGEISIGQDVSTTATPTFGNITTTGYIAGPSTFTIDPAAVGDNTGTLVVAGNLQVDGTTTTINSTTMTVDDLNITLASGAANAAAANGAGITVDGASANFTYNGTTNQWNLNKGLNVSEDTGSTPTVTINNTGTDATDGVALKVIASGRGTGIEDASIFSVHNNSSELFTVQNGGKVGIGTTSPSSALHVDSSNDGPIFDSGGTGNTNHALLVRDSANNQLLRVNNNGKVGIGTTSPSSPLTVKGTIGFEATNSTNRWSVYTYTDNTLRFNFNGAGADEVVIDSSGNVGVGTTSPRQKLTIGSLTVSSTATPDCIDLGGTYSNSAGSNLKLKLYEDGSITHGFGVSTASTDYVTSVTGTHKFFQSTNERMRLDSSGNLLVGTTNANPTSAGVNDAGVELSNTGGVRSTVASNPAATFNRKTDDGEVVLLRKDGTTKGSIGVYGNDIGFSVNGGLIRMVGHSIYREGSFGSGLHFTTNGVIPTNENGSVSSGTEDLGIANYRWKDLYLSGGAYLGGTGSANYLDDYEEGTWTPALYGTSTAGTQTQPNSNYQTTPFGYYTKIGNRVMMTAHFSGVALTNATGFLNLSGFPFTFTNVYGWSTYLEGFDPAFNKSLGGSNPTNHVILRGSGTTAMFGPAHSYAWDTYLNASTTLWNGGGNGVHGQFTFIGYIA